jgi:hypothetical protein
MHASRVKLPANGLEEKGRDQEITAGRLRKLLWCKAD